MASVKEMRNRIGSVKATQKITKAMQMVAAAKLRRAQSAAQNSRPYAQRMAAVIANLAAGVSGDGAPKLLVGTGSDQRHLVVIATSDRGLAGGFNTIIVRAARQKIDALLAAGKDVKVLTVGRKAASMPAASSVTLRWVEARPWPSPPRSPPASARCSRPERWTSSTWCSASSSRWSPRSRR